MYKSLLYKSFSVARFLWLRLWYRKRFTVARLSMIGKRCGIFIFKHGRITCTGRMILDDQVQLHARGLILLGDRFCVNQYSRIVAHESIRIGDNVTIGQSVTILDHDHHFEKRDGKLELDGYTTAPVRLGSNIWIGDKCTILKGVTIGDNVVIGAHTLIHKDVPSNVVVGGTPFKILKNL